jgi:predicted regulator of Ras-like GTPase activity (Roadblock/LC7/MglB family)
MLAIKQDKKENKFQNALEYLGEYRGVKGAVIFDIEGLVVGYLPRESFNAEVFSPLILLMHDNVNAIMKRLGEKPVQSIVVKSTDSWITIVHIGDLVLVVNADSDTDELLKVRIGQAVDMIKTHLKDKYPLLVN